MNVSIYLHSLFSVKCMTKTTDEALAVFSPASGFSGLFCFEMRGRVWYTGCIGRYHSTEATAN